LPDHLYIRPEDDQARHWRWRSVDADGNGESGAGALAAAAAAAAGRRIVLLVPGEQVLLTAARIPLRSRTRAAAAAPWALEDRLVSEVETQHFALGSAGDDGDWPVAVVARAFLDACLQACEEVGIAPHAALPEPLALPLPEADAWHAVEEGGRVVCRTGPGTGFACAATLLPTIAGALEPPAAVTLARPGEATAQWPSPLDQRLQVIGTLREPMAGFAAAPDRHAIDLLQGAYSRRERLGRLWRQWRAPAALAAILVVLLAAQSLVAYHELGRREQALRAAAERILREAAPDVGRIVDPRVQLKNRLEALRGNGGEDDSGLLPLLRRAGPVLTQRGEVTLTGLEWRNRTLDLSVEAGELTAVDALQRTLQDAGLAVELRGVQRDDENVRGEVRVEAPTS